MQDLLVEGLSTVRHAINVGIGSRCWQGATHAGLAVSLGYNIGVGETYWWHLCAGSGHIL